MKLFSSNVSLSARRRSFLRVEQLEDRTVPAVTAIFNSGVLTVTGDQAANNIRVAAAADGSLQVTNNNQAVQIRVLNGVANKAQTDLIVIDGKGGDDVLATDASLNVKDAGGTLVGAANVIMLGGAGNDSLTVGHGGIVGGLAGVDANGVVFGKVVGNAYMDGGAGDDSLISGFGNDIMFGGAGDDSYLWPPGTLTDFWDGGAGNDTATIIGNDTFLTPDPAADSFELTANGDGVLFRRINLVQFSVDMTRTENIVLKPGAGDDLVRIGDLSGAAHLKQVTVEGGDGNDTIDGSAQLNQRVSLVLDGGADNDVLKGGAGKDILRGGKGNDDLNGGAGQDQLQGGDGDDKLDGGDDTAKDMLNGGCGDDTFVARRKDVVEDLCCEDDDLTNAL